MPENTWYRRGPDINRLPSGHEPQMGLPIGVPDSEPFGIYICDEAADFIGKYLLADTRRQMGGILVGYVARSNRPFLLIRGAIEARDAEIVNGGVAFNDNSWNYMRQVWEREYPGSLVVGWFCSHPGYGTTLTGYDRFMHHRLFTRPWQVAFTVDSQRNASLFYRWEEDRLIPVENFVVWNSRKETPASLLPLDIYAGFQGISDASGLKRAPDKLVRPRYTAARAETAATVEMDRDTPTKKVPRARRSVTWFPWLILVLVMLFFLWPTLPWSIPHLWSSVDERRQELQQLENELDQSKNGQTNTTDQAETAAISQVSRASPGTAAVTPIDSASTAPEATSEPTTAVTATALQPATAVTTDTAATQPNNVTYEIKPGDTLWAISAREMGNPLAYHRLAQTNGITNPSLIYPGKKLQLVLEPTTQP